MFLPERASVEYFHRIGAESLHPINNFLRTSSSCIKYIRFGMQLCSTVWRNFKVCYIPSIPRQHWWIWFWYVWTWWLLLLQRILLCSYWWYRGFVILTQGCIASRCVPFCFWAISITFVDCYACSCALFCNARRRLPRLLAWGIRDGSADIYLA
jgi:hypothetical protein